jgi:hypothetical protein
MSKGKEIPASFFLPIGQEAPPQKDIEAFYRSNDFKEGATYTFANPNHSGIVIPVEQIRFFIDDSNV